MIPLTSYHFTSLHITSSHRSPVGVIHQCTPPHMSPLYGRDHSHPSSDACRASSAPRPTLRRCGELRQSLSLVRSRGGGQVMVGSCSGHATRQWPAVDPRQARFVRLLYSSKDDIRTEVKQWCIASIYPYIHIHIYQ